MSLLGLEEAELRQAVCHHLALENAGPAAAGPGGWRALSRLQHAACPTDKSQICLRRSSASLGPARPQAPSASVAASSVALLHTVLRLEAVPGVLRVNRSTASASCSQFGVVAARLSSVLAAEGRPPVLKDVQALNSGAVRCAAAVARPSPPPPPAPLPAGLE